jgi:hypothetical protein
MNLIKKTIFFTIAQGEIYENMSSNLFRSLKKNNPSIQTASICNNSPKFCDYTFKISDLCPNTKNINEASINNQSYSFKLGIYEKIPQDFLKKFDKIIFYDSDSFSINPIEIEDIIFESIFYVPWCQSIITQNKKISENIDLNWAWNGGYFYQHSEFAKIHNIKEWKNVNAGLISISTNQLFDLIDLYKYWSDKIYKFYGINHGTEELTFSLMMSDLDSQYQTPNICNNKLGQLCMDDTIENVTLNKKFNYFPWFNSTEQKYYEIIPTCVHFPGQKLKLIYYNDNE